MSEQSFCAEVMERSGEDLSRCYQCLKCSAGCPVTKYKDYKPNQIIRMVQYGEREKVLSCHAIWLCVSCMTCGVRCPNDIDMSAVFDTLREMSIEAGLAHEAERNVVVLHEEFVRSVRFWGRLHEVTFFLPYMARSLDLFGNAVSGIQLFARGKLPIMPSQIKGIDDFWKMYDEAYKTQGELARKD